MFDSVVEKWGITPEQCKELVQAMARTWDEIYSDWMACWEGGWSEALEAYGSERAMVAEATIDADRILQRNPNLRWVYDYKDPMALAEDVWHAKEKRW